MHTLNDLTTSGVSRNNAVVLKQLFISNIRQTQIERARSARPTVARVPAHAAAALDRVGVDLVKTRFVQRGTFAHNRRTSRRSRFRATGKTHHDEPYRSHLAVEGEVKADGVRKVPRAHAQFHPPNTRHEQVHSLSVKRPTPSAATRGVVIVGAMLVIGHGRLDHSPLHRVPVGVSNSISHV